MVSYVGIDFSVNSPSVCVKTNDKIKFITFYREKLSTFHSKLLDYDVSCIDLGKKSISKGKTEILERSKLQDSINISEKIVDSIKNLNGDVYVALEGFSFSSFGNKLTELSGYQYVLRRQILNEVLNDEIDKFFFFSPLSVKSNAASGKLDKKGMYDVFISDKFDDLARHLLYEKMQSQSDFAITKSDKVRKPIDDLVDSYFIMKLLEAKIKN